MREDRHSKDHLEERYEARDKYVRDGKDGSYEPNIQTQDYQSNAKEYNSNHIGLLQDNLTLQQVRKTITLKTIKNHITRIDVGWDIKINGFYGIFTGMIKKHILKGTEEALQRISEKVS